MNTGFVLRDNMTLMQKTFRTQTTETTEGMQDKRGITKELVNDKGLLTEIF